MHKIVMVFIPWILFQCKSVERSSLKEGAPDDAYAAYLERSAAELFPEPNEQTWCLDAPTELIFENSLRFDISWRQAFALQWLAWSNLDENRGQSVMLNQWKLQLLAEKEVNVPGVQGLNRGSRFTLTTRDGVLYLSFRHSDTAKDWLDNITFTARRDIKANFALADLNPAVKIHAGFYEALLPIWNDVLAALAAADPKREKPLFLAGHSLAASMAQLAAAGLAREGYPIYGVYMSGAPQVADEAWNTIADTLPIRAAGQTYALKDVSFEILNSMDLISRVPIRALDSRYTKDLATSFLPEPLRSNILLQNLGRDVYRGFIDSLERASGSELIDYRSFGKRYSLNQKGEYEGPGLADDVYWRTLRDDVVATPGILAKAEKLWNATNLHYVRFARGYGCQMFRQLRFLQSQAKST